MAAGRTVGESLPKKMFALPDIYAEFESELSTIENGYVDLRVHVTNNATENPIITKVKRRNGSVAQAGN
ncbi:MAG: hypothetical protein U0872_15380 [Planctomycetaceae bacterium]